MKRFWWGVVACVAWPSAALAHASERGHVLLLPTGYYFAGGAFAVAASFAILFFLKPAALDVYRRFRLPMWRSPERLRFLTSALSFALFVVLIAAGLRGSPDPTNNPLPLTIWTLLWVGVPLVQGLVGNVWRWIDPWYAPCLVVGKLTGRAEPAFNEGDASYIPAVILFCAFAWFELIYIAPEDPPRLSIVALSYWIVTFVFVVLFGHERWTRQGEFLTVFFSMIARFGIMQPSREKPETVELRLPGAAVAEARALPMSGVVFLLANLAAVSFDGFSKTFLWLGSIGINPLEFPGRSAVTIPNSVGLFTAMIAFPIVFAGLVRAGEWMASEGNREAIGLLVWSIVPIALAYHFAHYLTSLLVDGQAALIALSDPFARGWNLLGLSGRPLEAGIVMGHDAAWMLWNAVSLAIIAGHVLAVLIAHMLATRLYGETRAATVSQLPLAVLMVGYTLLGLWLLSTPSAG
ncbi:hypothetical protein DY251_00110 [Mesorhizobium denitrificans]|uniref:Fenitrothion hydrolase n=1 Tax=Mesorhizobium denitrificans TaxID=2294114 RepID=A0A371XK72_9HYPH|nr:hypothetical protein DY251_00110 [Mesorhizobium denitrificans]